jgi:hypothetical protein
MLPKTSPQDGMHATSCIQAPTKIYSVSCQNVGLWLYGMAWHCSLQHLPLNVVPPITIVSSALKRPTRCSLDSSDNAPTVEGPLRRIQSPWLPSPQTYPENPLARSGMFFSRDMPALQILANAHLKRREEMCVPKITRSFPRKRVREKGAERE